ncbi:MAG TPA: type II secretion system protein [Terriglobales bacterium]|nr:type II secretion system protein [Terriglobales bacterium]
MTIARKGGSRGFTLIEMMVVISIIVILLAVAMPIYSRSVNVANEDAFRQSLETLNKVIFQYTLDKQKPPQSLEDLRTAGYISEIPNDITGSKTWVVEDDPPSLLSLYQTDTGIYGVHSGSDKIGSDGRPYSEW